MSKPVGVLDSVPTGPLHVKGCGCAGFCSHWSTTCQRLWVCWVLFPLVHYMSKPVGVLDSVPTGPLHVKSCGCAGFCSHWSTTCQSLWVCWILFPLVHYMSKAVGVLGSVPTGPLHVKGCGCAEFCSLWTQTCLDLSSKRELRVVIPEISITLYCGCWVRWDTLIPVYHIVRPLWVLG